MIKKIPANAGDVSLIPWVRKIPWRRKWQPTPVFLPGKFHGQRNLAGYSSWDCKIVGKNLATKHTHIYIGFPGDTSGFNKRICLPVQEM